MVDFRFDADTAGQPVDDRTVAVRLHPDWNVDGRILGGGYLQAVTVSAAATLLGTPGDPVAVSTSFAAPAVPGAAEVSVQVLRRGGRRTAVTATLRQRGAVVLACLATFDAPPASPEDPDLPAAGSADASSPPGSMVMPDVAGPAESIRVGPEHLPGPPGLASLLDLAFVPEASDWLTGRGDPARDAAGAAARGRPRIRCWLSFADGRPLDALAAIALVDMAPPVSFAQGRVGWAPTLHLQVGVFGRPSGRHLLLDLVGEPYDGSVVAEDGTAWDTTGRLVARSRQIALVPRD